MSAQRQRRLWSWGAALVCLLLLSLSTTRARAHEFRPAFLEVTEVLDAAAGGVPVYELRLVSPKVSTQGPLEPGALTPVVPVHCERRPGRTPGILRLDCGERGLVGELGVAGLDRHPVDVVVALRWADGTSRTAVLSAEQPSLRLAGPERAGAVFGDYLRLGVGHIAGGFDHLAFVFGLVLLVADRRALLWTVTAFTAAHSLTLASASLELWSLPSAPVELCVALSIVFLARELAVGRADASGTVDPETRETLSWRAPWVIALGFGLLHGFGFAGALGEIGLPADQIPAALLGFNLGVELGQLGVVALVSVGIGALTWAQARVDAPAWVVRLIRDGPVWAMGAAAVAWTLERTLNLLAQ